MHSTHPPSYPPNRPKINSAITHNAELLLLSRSQPASCISQLLSA